LITVLPADILLPLESMPFVDGVEDR